VVVAAGLTDCVPPVADREYELPSLPDTVTDVPFAAVTVNIEELPAAIEAGLAVMLTEGAAVTELLKSLPHPVNTGRSDNIAIASSEEIRLRDRCAPTIITVSSFQLFLGETACGGAKQFLLKRPCEIALDTKAKNHVRFALSDPVAAEATA
jgi:hypothetical protein